jgi:hypothetical protein
MLSSGLLLLAAGAASAQTSEFNVGVIGHITRPESTTTCPEGASLCGQADIDGFGPAEYAISFLTTEFISDACLNYTAIATFTLRDGSTLTLDESGVACGTDGSFLKGPIFLAYGHPRYWSGTWDVQAGTGQFAGMTGSGADAGLTAGAAVHATYSGTLED